MASRACSRWLAGKGLPPPRARRMVPDAVQSSAVNARESMGSSYVMWDESPGGSRMTERNRMQIASDVVAPRPRVRKLLRAVTAALGVLAFAPAPAPAQGLDKVFQFFSRPSQAVQPPTTPPVQSAPNTP